MNFSISTAMLSDIHHAIQHTIHPSWQDKPPANWGTTKHGKLTAEQWRVSLEFDVTVSLVKEWSHLRDKCVDGLAREEYDSIIESTMSLAMAIMWGTSRNTSETHAQNYMWHMRTYIESLVRMGQKLVPNHHLALHLADHLQMFGPVHGWWTYPYERLIGTLGRISTHCKLGRDTILVVLKPFDESF